MNHRGDQGGENRENERKCKRSADLPKPRSRMGTLLPVLGTASFFTSSVFLDKKSSLNNCLEHLTVQIAVPWLLTFAVELFHRAILSCEEVQHLSTRYENDYKVLLKDVFHLNRRVYCFATIAIFLVTSFKQPVIQCWFDSGPYSILASIGGALFLRDVLNLQCGPFYESLAIEHGNGLDYGSGMAHSFFHGYLKLVIPKTGTSEKHLEELMKDYEASHRVRLAVYKLFILIPKSLYCPTSLMDTEFSPSIEESSSLPQKVITVAGVQNRVYKNSVYKINKNNRIIYVAAEYATPLKTFLDVVSHNGEHSNCYKKHRNDIVLHFYLTLQKILNENVDCTNFCELIFFDDRDQNGRLKDVGKILLRRIKKLDKARRNTENSNE